MKDTLLYWMWLQEAVGQGTSTGARILRRFSSVEEIYRATRSDYIFHGVPEKVLDSLCNKSLDRVSRLAERSRQGDCWMMTPDDADYPAPLHQLYSPPLVIYGKGRLPSFERMPVIGMVGTRKCTDYGRKVAGGLAAGLAAAGCTVISGGAVGIDCAAHEGALYGGGVTVAVQACGLDVSYPRPNHHLRQQIVESGGALISEYPPGTETTPAVFQVRNRLISGLSWGVCVIEAPTRSGSLITARLARDQGKDVFAVPGDITAPCSRGSNTLIREGAVMVTCAAHLLQEYQLRCGNTLDEDIAEQAQQAYYAYFDHPPVRRETLQRVADEPLTLETPTTASLVPLPTGVSDACRKVYEALSEERTSVEVLFEKTALPLGEIFSLLTELELYGCIRSHPGQHYSR